MKPYTLVVPKVLNFTTANKLYFIWTCYPKVAIHSHQKTSFILTQGADSYLWTICRENWKCNCFKEIHNSKKLCQTWCLREDLVRKLEIPIKAALSKHIYCACVGVKMLDWIKKVGILIILRMGIKPLQEFYVSYEK